jgi:hypothetical protein
MQRPRPLSIDIVAIFNFTFGTLAILGSLCGGGSIVFNILLAKSGILPPMPGGQPNPAVAQADLYANKIPGFIPVTTVSLTLGLIMGSLLIYAGIGMYKLRPSARRLCVIWSVYSLISVTFGTIYNLLVVGPALRAWMHDYYAQMGMPNMDQQDWSQYGSIFGAIFGVSYAVLLPILLYRRSVSDALAGKWVPPWLQNQKGDEEDVGELEIDLPPGAPNPASQAIRPAQE